MTIRDKAEIDLYRARFLLHWLRTQVHETEKELFRLMKRLDIDTNETGDLPRPIYCTNCGFKMVDADELCVLAGQWTCGECYRQFILDVDGYDLNTKEGLAEYQQMLEDEA